MVDMETIAERFKTSRQAAGLSQLDLGKATGVTKQTISAIERGETTRPNFDTIERAARVMQVNPRWLMHGTGQKAAGLTVREPDAEYLPMGAKAGYIRFLRMEGTASAGAGSVNTDYPDVLESVDIAEWQVKQLLGYIPAEGRVQMVTVRGDSNWPKIKNGDVVFIDTHIRHFDGDAFYLINLHGFTMLKRLQLQRDGLHVRSVNPAYESEVLAPGEFDQIHIGGRMLSAAQFRRSEEI